MLRASTPEAMADTLRALQTSSMGRLRSVAFKLYRYSSWVSRTYSLLCIHECSIALTNVVEDLSAIWRRSLSL